MPRTNAERSTDPLRRTRSIAETARILGCGPTIVREMIAKGTLKAIKAGNRLNPTVSSIEKLLGEPLIPIKRDVLELIRTPAQSSG